jgi:hypothetical protein
MADQAHGRFIGKVAFVTGAAGGTDAPPLSRLAEKAPRLLRLT